jgi:TonB family protein
MRNLKYPASARQNSVEGFAVANFSLKDKKIRDVQIEKGLQADIDADIIRALSLYNSELELADGKYFFAVGYRLMGSNTPVAEVPDTGGKNFVGRVIVTAMSGNNPKVGEDLQIDPQEGELPQFPGGLKAWNEYISKNLKYPSKARENNIEGRVILSFVVDTDGSIEDIKVLRGIGAGADEEAVRIVAQSPKWKPVLKDGVPAKAAYTMPITFSLTGKLPQNPRVNQNVTIPNRSLTEPAVLDFASVEVLPEPPAGMAGWGKYLSANLKYPEQAKKDKVTGRVILSFVVEKDGKLNDIQVLRGIGSGLDEEAVRVLKSSPNWKPGILNGRPVRVAYTMPIFFQLAPEEKKN